MVPSLALSALFALGGVVLPFGFEHTLVVGEPFVGQPVGFAFLPDGRPLLVERQGGVRIAAAGEALSVQIHQVRAVNSGHLERGLLGVAIDPSWPARPYVYLHYTHRDSVSHVAMYEASGDLDDPGSTNLALGNPFLLLADVPDSVGIHNGGTLRFGPDGMLYVALGDDAGGCHAQQLDSFLGKILRLDVSKMPRSGAGPPPLGDLVPIDNPLPGPGDVARLVFAWGLRNPFRFTIDSERGDVFIGSVGSDHYEEINRVPAGSGALNFGWPVREGAVRITRFGDCGIENVLTDAIHEIAHHPGAISVVGGPVVRRAAGRAGFPESYEGDYFYFELFGGTLHRLRESSDGWGFAPPAPGQPDSTTWASGLVGASDAQLGPDGALYFVAFDVAQATEGLHRIGKRFDDAPFDADRAISVEISPNPSRGHVSIRHDAPESDDVVIRVTDVVGRAVRTVRSNSPALSWDGRDESGRAVPAGTYFVRIDSETGFRGQAKLTLLR